MNQIHKDLKSYILYYSDIHDKEVSKIIDSGVVTSETDAKKLLSFIDTLFKYSNLDMENGKIVLGEVADISYAEEAAIAILAILRANNFNDLVNSWK